MLPFWYSWFCVVLCCVSVSLVKQTSGKDIWTLGKHRRLVESKKGRHNLDFYVFSS